MQTIFTPAELQFIRRNELCRVATSSNDVPHVVPVSYIFESGLFIFSTAFVNKKYKNLANNKNIAILVDEFISSMNNRGILVKGQADLVTKISEFKRLYDVFRTKWSEWYELHPWTEYEGTYVKLNPISKVTWGIPS